VIQGKKRKIQRSREKTKGFEEEVSMALLEEKKGREWR